ncbi:MAG: DNA polymerase III subunit alpha, partial [Alphaproteobacteria bacterium]|nr:DNA polymerase III subunit alpha [Alphaproteobacteria bacterium]
ITDLDPIRWGLLFERFLNPERISMPDFDIDFCQDRREEVIAYVQQKYGIDRVAQIITFGSLQARAALRDAGRVMGMPYSQVDRIAKLVPSNPAKPVKLTEALKSEKDLKEAVNADEQVTDLMNVSIQIEGLLRHSSTHAAGLVIGDRPLAELVPLTQDPRSELPVTQFNMKSVEDAGLVKFDFLGLKTLTVLQLALDLIKRKGISLDLIDIPLEDEATFAMLGEGDTVGLFQLESSGMREVLKGLKPDRFEDIIAVVALYRPGPMENIPKYIARKHGREKVDYMHPLLEPVLDETYGIMIYQEQVQRAAQVLSGYSLGKADILRRAMGKKIASEMAAQRDEFVAGADANSIDKNLAGQIFDQISAFAGYGFNKSHAAAYALIAWQTAWL